MASREDEAVAGIEVDNKRGEMDKPGVTQTRLLLGAAWGSVAEAPIALAAKIGP